MRVKRKIKYPNLNQAARNMGYDVSYIWRVLEGKPGYPGRAGLVEDFWKESQRIEEMKKKEKGK